MCITKGTIIQEKNKLNTILQLAKNDIRSRYSNSLLGIVWAFIMPLVTILVFWYVFPWIFFVDVVTQGCNCLVEYSFLVKKIKFDVGRIPIIKVLSALFVHAFFVVFLLVMFLVYGYGLTPYALQIIYYSFSVCALGLGLTWLLAAVTVFFKDMSLYFSKI